MLREPYSAKSYTYNSKYIDNRLALRPPLTGNLQKIYAMDLVHPYRLEFEKTADSICTVRIITIEDYN